jgi:hypothetical protein
VRSFLSAAVVGFAAFVACAPLHAQTSSCDVGTFQQRLRNRYFLDSCWNENKALQQRVERAKANVKPKDEPPSGLAARAREQLILLRREVDARVPTRDYADALKKSLDEAIAQLALLPGIDSLDAAETYRALQTDTWKLDAAPTVPGGQPQKYLRDSGCAAERDSNTKCREVFQRAVEYSDDLLAAGYVIGVLHEKAIKDGYDQAVLREKRWHAYLYDTQFQYWWELGLNRWREETCFDSFVFKCDKQGRDADGNPLGFRDPPTNRAVFFHPDVGVQYLDAEPKGDKFKPALVVQWFGYQWWDWKDNSDKVHGLRGLSFASTISDNANYKALGWGAHIQINEYALAFTSHSGKLAITLNLQLGDKISKLNDEWADKLKKAKGK